MKRASSKAEAQALREKMAGVIKSILANRDVFSWRAMMLGSARTGETPDQPKLAPGAVMKAKIMEPMGREGSLGGEAPK